MTFSSSLFIFTEESDDHLKTGNSNFHQLNVRYLFSFPFRFSSSEHSFIHSILSFMMICYSFSYLHSTSSWWSMLPSLASSSSSCHNNIYCSKNQSVTEIQPPPPLLISSSPTTGIIHTYTYSDHYDATSGSRRKRSYSIIIIRQLMTRSQKRKKESQVTLATQSRCEREVFEA